MTDSEKRMKVFEGWAVAVKKLLEIDGVFDVKFEKVDHEVRFVVKLKKRPR